MKRLLIAFLILFTLAFGGLMALKALNPSSYHSLLISFELVPDAAAEKARLDKISLLAISDEKKQILTNRTVFMGASTQMVELALGTAISAEHFDQYQPPIDRWVYHFADDGRPTVLEFHDNKLTSAYKVSAHKLNLEPADQAAPAGSAGQ